MDINEQKLNFHNLVGTIHQIHHVLAEYAIANMDNNLFVSKYLLQLSRKGEMKKNYRRKN